MGATEGALFGLGRLPYELMRPKTRYTCAAKKLIAHGIAVPVMPTEINLQLFEVDSAENV